MDPALLQILLLLIEKGIPEGLKLINSLGTADPTAAQIRALREGVEPPEEA